MMDDYKMLFNDNLGGRSQTAFHIETSNPTSDFYTYISIPARKIILPKSSCIISQPNKQTNIKELILSLTMHLLFIYLSVA